MNTKREEGRMEESEKTFLIELGKQLSNIIIDASLYWSGKDEERNPPLRTARTLADLYLRNFYATKGGK